MQTHSDRALAPQVRVSVLEKRPGFPASLIKLSDDGSSSSKVLEIRLDQALPVRRLGFSFLSL